MYFCAGSSSDSLPSSRSWSSAIAVKLLVSDARRKTVSMSTGCLESRSRTPYPFDQTISPSTTRPTTRPGRLRRCRELREVPFELRDRGQDFRLALRVCERGGVRLGSAKCATIVGAADGDEAELGADAAGNCGGA